MYSLDELFRGSTYKASVFMPETVKWLESRIVMKQSRGGEVPYVKCIIRNKEVRLTPEEAVRQLYVYELIHKEGYPVERISLEQSIQIGRDDTKRADIVIFDKDHPEAAYIIVEVKKPNLHDGKEQLKSYCNASGAIIGVWTNGEDIDYYQRKDPNIFESLTRIPKASEPLDDVFREKWTLAKLTAHDRLKDGKKTLKALIQEMEDEVLANAGVDAFEEVFKLIYTKLYDEIQSGGDPARFLEFRRYGGKGEHVDKLLKRNIQELFNHAKKEWPDVFDDKAEIELTPSHLAVCVSTLQDVKLLNSNLDVVDDAFEYLMNQSQKGAKGQFFTPRYVIEMCVRMLNPSEDEAMIDTAAGSCGFPVHTMFYVWRKMSEARGIKQSHLFTAEKKPKVLGDYVRDKIFAIDFDDKAVRVARTLNLIAGDGRTNVLHLNTLDYDMWEQAMKPRKWQKAYSAGWLRFTEYCETEDSYRNFLFDIVMANPPFAGDIHEERIIHHYELAKDSKGKYVSKIGRDILFIERNLQFLKPGGRMAIILPQGRFNNSSDKYIRDFIAERCRILAVIGLHENVFKPHTGTKTSVLLVQKWDDELCPRVEDYPVFFATMRKPGKDNSGEKVYVKNPDGTPKLDGHNHPIVEHDLYNHDGLTEDGIAEAFREFAVREGLSFFGGARFDEEKYSALRSGLEISEVMLSAITESTDYFRLEAEYFNSRTLSLTENLKGEDIISGIQYGTSKLCDENSNGYPVLRLNELDNGFINEPQKYCHLMSASEFETLRLKKGDVLVIRTNGNSNLVGRSAVVMEDSGYAFASYLFRVSVNGKINPCTIVAFMNGRYGRVEIDRLSMKGNQTNFSPAKFRDMQFPKISEDLQERIQGLFETAYSCRQESTALYAAAQSLLTSRLGQVPQDHRNTTVRTLSEAFSAGRLDAEYFMPKYDGYLQLLNSFETTSIPAEYNVFKNSGTNYSEKSHDVGVIKTKQLTNRGINTDGVESWFDIDTCAGSTFLHTGDVVFASMGVGSLGKVSIFTYEGSQRFVTDSTLRIYRAKNDARILPEVLCVFLQSEIAQELIYRYVVGSTGIINIYDKDIARIPIPILDTDTQHSISTDIQRSFSLRKKSDSLIRSAVHAVELAVESSEHTAVNFISQEVTTTL